MFRLALGNVLQRPTRTFLSAIAIAVEVALVLLLIGLTNGTLSDAGRRIENIQSDIIVLPPGGQMVLGMSSAVMPLAPVKAALEAAPDVLAVTPVVFATTNAFGSYGLIFGIETRSYGLAGRGGLDFVAGRSLEGPDDLVVDTRLAQSQQLRIGQSVRLLNRSVTVVGIVRDGAGVRMYLPIATVQEQEGREGKASVFFVRVSDPEKVPAVLDRLKRTPAFKGYNVFASAQYGELLGMNTFGVKEFNAAITSIAVVFGFIVISLSMYTTVLERTRQIGIVKSIGAERGFIAAAIVLEAALLCLIGIPAGFGLAAAAKLVLHATHPTLMIVFAARWWLNAAALALLSGVLGALYPALRAASVDPVIALSYE